MYVLEDILEEIFKDFKFEDYSDSGLDNEYVGYNV